MAFVTKRSSWLPPLFVFLVISFIYVVYFLFHLLPQLKRLNFLQYSSSTPIQKSVPNDPHMYPASAAEVITLMIGFHFCFAFFLASFFQAMVTSPGTVPHDDPKWERGAFGIEEAEDKEVERIIRDTNTDLNQPHIRDLLKRMPIVERKKGKPPGAHADEESASLIADSDELKRKCHGCMVYKPDRVHHCSVCGHCVLRMDHHCPWIANCVGFRNYKYFLLVLIWAVLAMGFMIASMLPRFINVFSPILDVQYFLRRDLFIAIVFVAVTLLFIVLSIFLGFHIYLVCNAMSTIEYREKKNHGDAEVKHRWRVSHIKYDRGSAYQNFKHVMGEPYMWLFPVDPRPHDDGTYTMMEDDLHQQQGKSL